MKRNLIKSAIPLLAIGLFTITSCGGSNNNENGGGKITVTLWGWGDEAEINVFTDLIRNYNETNDDNVYVNFVKKPSSNYYSTLETALTGRQAPDLFYVGDSMIKRYANAGYIEDLTSYIDNSEVIDLSDIWGTLMERYQFNPDTYQYDSSAEIWGLPKDIGPTVIYYNEDAFKAQGITIISAKDDDGDGLVTYEGKEYPARGYDPDTKVFNNKIAMTFEELEAISPLFMHETNSASQHRTKWSYYSSWWFFAGWSVGGDCIQFHETDDPQYNDGYWEFTLNDDRPNYRVLKDVTLNGHEYKAGDFVDYYDLPYMEENIDNTNSLVNDGTLVALPSILDTFEWWIDLFHSGISPKPSDISNSLSLFTNQEVAMYVEGRYQTVQFRKNCDFAWDVAPLPKHENGVSAGHSGSMCLSMSTRSEVKDEAFKIIEYLCGPEGQDALAETGFNVPSQISLANDPEGNFLSSTERPYNNEIFLDAAEIQKGGDWTYLKDDAWINIWAPTLNGDVLNGVQTVEQLFARYGDTVNEALKEYTKK